MEWEPGRMSAEPAVLIRRVHWLQQEASGVMDQNTCKSVMLLAEKKFKDEKKEKDSYYCFPFLCHDGTYILCVMKNDDFQCPFFKCLWISLRNPDGSQKMALLRWSGHHTLPVEQQEDWTSCIMVKESRTINSFPLLKSVTDGSLEDWNQKHADFRLLTPETEIYGREHVFQVPAFAYEWINTLSSVGRLPMVLRFPMSFWQHPIMPIFRAPAFAYNCINTLSSVGRLLMGVRFPMSFWQHPIMPNLNISYPKPTIAGFDNGLQLNNSPVNEPDRTRNSDENSNGLHDFTGGGTSSRCPKGFNNYILWILILLAMPTIINGIPVTSWASSGSPASQPDHHGHSTEPTREPQAAQLARNDQLPLGKHYLIHTILKSDRDLKQTEFNCDVQIDDKTYSCNSNCNHSLQRLCNLPRVCQGWENFLKANILNPNTSLNHSLERHVLQNTRGLIVEHFNVTDVIYRYTVDGNVIPMDQVFELFDDPILKQVNGIGRKDSDVLEGVKNIVESEFRGEIDDKEIFIKYPGPNDCTPSPLDPGPNDSTPSPLDPGPNASTPSPLDPGPNASTPSPLDPGPNASTPSPLDPGPNASTPSPLDPGPNASTPSPLDPGPNASTPSPLDPGPNASTPSPLDPGPNDSTACPPDLHPHNSTSCPDPSKGSWWMLVQGLSIFCIIVVPVGLGLVIKSCESVIYTAAPGDDEDTMDEMEAQAIENQPLSTNSPLPLQLV
ncbi:uncharacterized protein [Hyperolius riggenbachi]|uniref:uncharacterized protein isoform X2 n=1 Tax=Hyperolius riggenbachi TaxID=752182 RepID=UPI0035A2E1CC